MVWHDGCYILKLVAGAQGGLAPSNSPVPRNQLPKRYLETLGGDAGNSRTARVSGWARFIQQLSDYRVNQSNRIIDALR
jgi:hypothetical protein